MLTPVPLDIALAYDPTNRRCDVVFNGVDFALDTTFQTPVLMSLGCDRRAHPDDDLPQPYVTLPADAPLMNLKRGWAGDALDPRGELTGSRQWTLARSKLDETIRRRALSIDAEALSALTGRLGVAMTLTVERLNRNALAHRVQVGKQTLVVPQVIGT
jgi:phage gp46-like protein